MTAAPLLARMPEKPIPRTGWFHALRWAFGFRNHALELVRRTEELHGPVVMNGFGMFRAVSLFGPEANRFVLLDREGQLSARGSWDLIMGRIFGGGLLLRDGAEHRQHRRIMQEAFKAGALAQYCARMTPHVVSGVDAWLAQGDRLFAFPAFKHLTLDLAFRVFAGVELGREAERICRAFEATVAASMSLVRLPLPGLEFQRGLAGRREMGAFFAALLPERRARPGSDMLSRLCQARAEDGSGLTDQEIVDHMNFLMMAAHDTTTSTLTSLVYLLGKHPEWQERVREESLALSGDELRFEEQERLATLTHAIHETLRLYPPLSTIPRLATEEIEFHGFRIPKGAMVSIYPIHTHRMPGWWSEPERFDPDRFAHPRQEHRRHSHLFVPFGGGAHMCLGLRFAEMQIRAIAHAMVRRLRWELAPGYSMPVQEAPISKPRDGLPIRLRPLA